VLLTRARCVLILKAKPPDPFAGFGSGASKKRFHHLGRGLGFLGCVRQCDPRLKTGGRAHRRSNIAGGTVKCPKGLYHKGTGDTRKTRAEAPFAAQMDEQRQKGKILQEDFGNSSVLHPVFLLFVRGHFGKTQMPDCPLRKQERSFAKFYTNHLQISMREGAAA